jgi:hypothetical protein
VHLHRSDRDDNDPFVFAVADVVSAFGNASATCLDEFERCVMNRDCCEGYRCVMGDWEVTTDSTCLSDRSVQLNALERSKKVALIQRYYETLGDGEAKKHLKTLRFWPQSTQQTRICAACGKIGTQIWCSCRLRHV